MPTQLTFPGMDNELFWVFFSFGRGSAGGMSLVGFCYFHVFVRFYTPRWVANVIDLGLLAFLLCIIFALGTFDRALNVSHFELSALSTFSFLFGMALPVAAACFLHRHELKFR